jgi:hypothetical protein
LGPTRSGKTHRLIEQFVAWAEAAKGYSQQAFQATLDPLFLIFAATGDNRLTLVDRITTETTGQYRFESTTPLGFFQDEVILFFPLLVQELGLKTQFPLRLRPETEQEMATQLWRSHLDEGHLEQAGVSEYYLVRRALDLLQIAATSGTPPEDLAAILQQGFTEQEGSLELWETMAVALRQWRSWCLERGLLTYGIVTELYWRYLLPHPTYQSHLRQRFQGVLADDVDEYPAIARPLFEFFLDQDIPVAFTYNPNGGIRLGLGADPYAMAELGDRCHQIERLSPDPSASLGNTWGMTLLEWLRDPMRLPALPPSFQSIQTQSRAELLRNIAEVIVDGVHTGEVQPQEVAVIAPGLDAIAQYTLREILTSKGIPVRSLNDQQPLASSPLIRSLLTLLTLIYPGLGQMLNGEAIAEMLVLLSQVPLVNRETPGEALSMEYAIDPVRAGLLIDHCYVPDLENPRLLSVDSFARWDRLGYQAAQVYGAILQWIEVQKEQQQQRLLPSPVVLLDRAIQRFLYGGSHLPYDQLASLRELMETAQHYWEVVTRLRQYDEQTSEIASEQSTESTEPAEPSQSSTPQSSPSITVSVQNFIELLRKGTITADPYPVRPMGKAKQAVTLATIYQYRGDRRSHRWQFWLDASSPLWLSGGGPLFGAPLFQQKWSGRPLTAAEILAADQQRLQRQVLDLLCRTEERVYLCHSDLATNGQEQAGPLLPLVNAAVSVESQ